MKLESNIVWDANAIGVGYAEFKPPIDYYLSSITISNQTEIISFTPAGGNWKYYCRVLKYYTPKDYPDVGLARQQYEVLFEGWISNKRMDVQNTGVPLNSWYGSPANVTESGNYFAFTGITIPIDDIIDNDSKILVILNDQTLDYQVALDVQLHYSDWIYPKRSTYNEEKHRGIWHFNQQYIITAAAPMNIRYTPDAGAPIEILDCLLTAANYAANETFTVLVRDQNDNVTQYVMISNAMDNNVIGFPSIRTYADDVMSNAGILGVANTPLMVVYPDYLEIATSTIAINATITVNLRAKLHSTIPAVEIQSANTTANAAYADDYEEIR